MKIEKRWTRAPGETTFIKNALMCKTPWVVWNITLIIHYKLKFNIYK